MSANLVNPEIVRVSGSTLDRIARCDASAALPQIHNEDENDGRDRGSAVHKFLERVPVIGREAALAEVDEKYRDLCGDIDLAKLADKLRLSREVALAYNFVEDTARQCERDEQGRVIIDRSCEVAVILDLLGNMEAERWVYVGDYKTGRAWLPSPERSAQLALGALAAARWLGARRARVEYLRIRDDGTVRKFNAELDGLALDAAAEQIAKLMERVKALRARVLDGFVPNVIEGPWCKYCPASQHCPAKTALVRHVMNDPSPVQYVLPLTPEVAVKAYNQLKRAKDGLHQIESALYAYAKQNPLLLEIEEDGSERWFGELTREGNDVLDGVITHRILTAHYGGEEANKAVTLETSKKAVNDVVRKNLKLGDKVTKVFDAIVAEIDKAGGVDNPITTTTTEYSKDPASGEIRVRKRKAAGS